jgi:hypothetical protein
VKEAEQGWAVIVEVWEVADLYWGQVMGLGKSKPGVAAFEPMEKTLFGVERSFSLQP